MAAALKGRVDSTIDGMFPGGLAPEARAEIITALQSSGCLTLTGTKVSYA